VKANQKAVRGVPTEINELNEPVKSISEATIDLGKVVAAVKEFEKSGQTLEDDIKAQILKNEKEATTILERQVVLRFYQKSASSIICGSACR
jgi:spoIIIJ-associated protein